MSGNDTTIVKLFCVWVFSQCFVYEALPSFRWELGITVSADRLMLCIMLFAYATRLAYPKASPRPGTMAARMLGQSMLLFGLVGAVSLLFSKADADDNANFYHLSHLFNISFLPTIAYLVARKLQYTRAMLKQILVFLAVLGVYLSFTSVCERYDVTSLVFPKYILDPAVGGHYGRSRGPFADAIGMGGMLLVSFLVLTCVSSSLAGFKRVLTLLLTLLVVPAVYFTDTRAVWLGLAAIIATLFSLRTSMRRTVTIVGCAMLIAFLSGIGSKFSMFESTLFSRRQKTVDYRLDNYQIAWTAFKKNPLFGVGYGKFRQEWSNYFNGLDSRTRGMDDGNHSTGLGILAELGATGFAPFLAILACSALVCLTAYRRLRDDQWEFERKFVVVGLGALEAFFILGLTNDLNSAPVVNICAFWLIGIVSSLHSSALQRTVIEAGERHPPAGAKAPTNLWRIGPSSNQTRAPHNGIARYPFRRVVASSDLH